MHFEPARDRTPGKLTTGTSKDDNLVTAAAQAFHQQIRLPFAAVPGALGR
jgi:hypothetical protein